MLSRLRHDAVIGGHDQQGQVDPARAGQHGVDQPFMPRHVDEAGDGAAAKIGIGKSQVDGDASGLFLCQAVGIRAGQRLDQSGLAVVDMPRGRSRSHAARRSGASPPAPLIRSPADGIVSVGSEPDPIWLAQSVGTTR